MIASLSNAPLAPGLTLSSGGPAPAQPLGERPVLLVVDDEQGPRESLRLIFGQRFRVLAASTGREALDWVRREPVAVAILDIRMEGMNGIEVLREIKALRQEVEVVMLTAFETLQTARDAVRYGASDYLSKPFDIVHIQTVVERCLGRYHWAHRREAQWKEDLSRAKNEFLTVLSHELNTPLNGVMGFLELLGQTRLTEEQQDLVKELFTCSQELYDKISDLLNYAQLTANAYRPSSELFNPASLLLRTLQRQPRQRGGVKLDVEISPDLPGFVRGPEAEIQIILAKLLDNAWKFTAQGLIRLEAKSRHGRGGKMDLVFAVEDSGTGIPGEWLRDGRLMEPMRPGDSSDRRGHSGLGMGLALCHRLCARIGSELLVESRPGQGSRFWFAVPVERPE